MKISLWYDNLSSTMQKLVASKVDGWSVAALKELPKLSDEMVKKLVSAPKQTVNSIRLAVKPQDKPRKTFVRELYPNQPEIDPTDLKIGDKLIFTLTLFC